MACTRAHLEAMSMWLSIPCLKNFVVKSMLTACVKKINFHQWCAETVIFFFSFSLEREKKTKKDWWLCLFGNRFVASWSNGRTRSRTTSISNRTIARTAATQPEQDKFAFLKSETSHASFENVWVSVEMWRMSFHIRTCSKEMMPSWTARSTMIDKNLFFMYMCVCVCAYRAQLFTVNYLYISPVHIDIKEITREWKKWIAIVAYNHRRGASTCSFSRSHIVRIRWLSTSKRFLLRGRRLLLFTLSQSPLVHICQRRFFVAYRSTSFALSLLLLLFRWQSERARERQAGENIVCISSETETQWRVRLVVVVMWLKLDHLSTEDEEQACLPTEKRISLYYFKFVDWKLLASFSLSLSLRFFSHLSTFDLKP